MPFELPPVQATPSPTAQCDLMINQVAQDRPDRPVAFEYRKDQGDNSAGLLVGILHDFT